MMTCMPGRQSLPLGRVLWQVAKGLAAAAILAAVAWTFYHALKDLDRSQYRWQPRWWVLSGVLYQLSMFPSVLFWTWAMRRLGQAPSLLAATRAYLVGTLGKYVPGKALVIIMRTALVRGPRVRISVAALTVVYETFICMATAAIWVVIILGVHYSEEEARLEGVLSGLGERTGLVGMMRLWQVLVVVGCVACLPAVPAVFSRLARGAVRPFQRDDAEPLPAVPAKFFPVGLFLESVTWAVSGLALWAAVNAVHEMPLTAEFWLRCTAYLGLATVIGFFTPVPAGLGVRELVLLALLTPEVGQGPAALVAPLLRFTWIVSEVVAVAILYPLGYRSSRQPTDHDVSK
jgi:uncharacterized membrane protein YbhN (UPF0104 family)